ncbi:MAG: DUF4160 domain-containing protein [Elusimicrobia bacterium]|nr:DUF4160 domain-containing protein [Elusimicrobiota bacterium]
MPKIFEWKGYKFFFFSNEGKPSEPCHVHARKGACLAKFWVDPEIRLASSWGMSSNEVNRLQKVVEREASLIRRKWNEYFNT